MGRRRLSTSVVFRTYLLFTLSVASRKAGEMLVLVCCLAFLALQALTDLPSHPAPGQRCAGRNYPGGRRCCTPEQPCGEGEGDCDGPGDGGQHDGNAGCKGDLVCGSNNCRKFGRYYHEKDDCCEKPSETETGPSITYYPNTPLAPPAGGCCS